MIIPILTGPTASGKTYISIEIAKNFNLEIISADSRQVYKYLDIGTAKPTKVQQTQVKHHLIDFLELEENYSAGRWLEDVDIKIKEIFDRGKYPFIVGGTAFYIYVLINGIFKEQGSIPQELVYNLKLEYDRDPNGLYNKLLEVDKEWAEMILPTDKQRIVRGLSFFLYYQKPLSKAFKEDIFKLNYDFLLFVLKPDKDLLNTNIERRVYDMIDKGLENEVRFLFSKYKDFNKYNVLNTVGYKEWVKYFEGNKAKDKVIKEIIRNTKKFAKKQNTFFNNKFTNKIEIKYRDINYAIEALFYHLQQHSLFY